ncbi:MAG: histone deacetylase [Chloroflexi bacterium]|nr:histone deacetylase [Chloroflexota bacterium]
MTTIYVTHPRYPEHDFPQHPEHAGRIRAVWRRLDAAGLTSRMNAVTATPATDDMLLAVHAQGYLRLLERLSAQQRTVLLDADTYATPTSYEIARLAAGGVVRAVDAVLRGDANNGLAVVRPPGHHAVPQSGMGFCLLSNIAIAARYAQQQHGVERILIVDYDVHHGNGTEAAFYDDSTVLFVSTHQFPLYPGTGTLHDVGSGPATGFTVNVPIPGGHSDGSYAAIFEHIIWPLAERFAPQLVLVSAGYDGHWADPLAGMRLSLAGYDHLARELLNIAERLCDGKIDFVIEGGYNLDVLSYGVGNLAHVLLGDPEVDDPLGPPDDGRAEPDIASLIAQVRTIHNLPSVSGDAP